MDRRCRALVPYVMVTLLMGAPEGVHAQAVPEDAQLPPPQDAAKAAEQAPHAAADAPAGPGGDTDDTDVAIQAAQDEAALHEGAGGRATGRFRIHGAGEACASLAGLLLCVPVAALLAIPPGILGVPILAGWGGAMLPIGRAAMERDARFLLWIPTFAAWAAVVAFYPVYGVFFAFMCAGPSLLLPFVAFALPSLAAGAALGGGAARWWLNGRNLRQGIKGALHHGLNAALALVPVAALVLTGAFISATLWGLAGDAWYALLSSGAGDTFEEQQRPLQRAAAWWLMAPLLMACATGVVASALLMVAVAAVPAVVHAAVPWIAPRTEGEVETSDDVVPVPLL